MCINQHMEIVCFSSLKVTNIQGSILARSRLVGCGGGRRTFTGEKLGGEFHLGQSQGKYVGEAAADFGGESTRKLVLGEDIHLGEIRGRCVLLRWDGY